MEKAIDDAVAGTGGFKATNSFAVAWKDVSFFGGDPASLPYPVYPTKIFVSKIKFKFQIMQGTR